MINRIHLAKTFLANHPEYTLRRICFVWCQGESDGDIGTTEGEYEQRLEELKRGLTDEGVSAFFLISIGEKTGKTPNDYKNIRSAQEHFCMVNGKCTLVSSFYGLSGYMKDEYHYTQECYNMVGTEAGEKSGLVLLN